MGNKKTRTANNWKVPLIILATVILAFVLRYKHLSGEYVYDRWVLQKLQHSSSDNKYNLMIKNETADSYLRKIRENIDNVNNEYEIWKSLSNIYNLFYRKSDLYKKFEEIDQIKKEDTKKRETEKENEEEIVRLVAARNLNKILKKRSEVGRTYKELKELDQIKNKLEEQIVYSYKKIVGKDASSGISFGALNFDWIMIQRHKKEFARDGTYFEKNIERLKEKIAKLEAEFETISRLKTNVLLVRNVATYFAYFLGLVSFAWFLRIIISPNR